MARPRSAAVMRELLGSLSHRALSTTPRAHASILFALSSLSNSRETEHFNKITHLPRFEHSPPLKLIKQSEVDPFPLPEPDKPVLRSTLPSPWAGRSQRNLRAQWDERALKAGRVILTDNARREARLKLALKRTQQRVAKQRVTSGREKAEWQRERAKLRNEMRIAGIWILASIGTATALATWRFWPQQQTHMDSGELGRRIASRARAAIPLPAARTSAQAREVAPVNEPVGAVKPGMISSGSNLPQAVPVERTAVVASVEQVGTKATVGAAAPESVPISWWKGLFWKQSS